MRKVSTFLDILLRPIWKWVFVVPFQIVGWLSYFRPDIVENPSINALLDWMAWYWWVIIGLLIAIIWGAIQATQVKLALENGSTPSQDIVRENKIAPDVEIDIERIMLADGYSVGFPGDRTQEYSFTIINESGEDIKECYVTLDASARRISEDDEWEIEQIKLIDAPFRWTKSGASSSGRLNIEGGDRATFALGRSTQHSAMDTQTGKSVPFFQFLLALHGEEDNGGSYDLLINYFYRLLITIRSKEQDGKRLPDVSYELYLRPTASAGPAGGLEVQGQVRVSKEQDTTITDRKILIGKLHGRREIGIPLRNAGKTKLHQNTVDAWWQEFLKWKEETKNTIGLLDSNRARKWAKLGTFTPKRGFPQAISRRHEKRLQMFDAWLDRLDLEIDYWEQKVANDEKKG